MFVIVRATEVALFGNGLVGLEIQSRSLEADERKLINSLFPNTEGRVMELLDREALLTAMDGNASVEGITPVTHKTLTNTPKVKRVDPLV